MQHVTYAVVFRDAGPEVADVLALLWGKAEAQRRGQSLPSAVNDAAVEAVRARLETNGAVALVGFDADQPVAGCFATQAMVDNEPVAGRAHVSGIAVLPERWGEGLAH